MSDFKYASRRIEILPGSRILFLDEHTNKKITIELDNSVTIDGVHTKKMKIMGKIIEVKNGEEKSKES